MEISLCMIVKNENDVLARCLESVKALVDEIIIIDTGSSDDTKEIARKFTPHVYDFAWCDDFAKARNYAFSKATKDYQMWLDADDIFQPDDQVAFLKMKQNWDDSIDMAMLMYHVAFDEEDKPTFSYYRERILKRSMHFQWIDPVHEVISQRGKVQYFQVAVSHKKLHASDPRRNLNIYQKMLDQGNVLNPRQKFYYARELFYNQEDEQAVPLLQDVIQDPSTWLQNRIDAARIKAQCHTRLKQPLVAKQALLQVLAYTVPTSEICCELGALFFQDTDYKTAIYWYENAMRQIPDLTDGGFHETDTYQFIPAIQLCVCHDKLQNHELAIHYNEVAGGFKPKDRRYLFNKEYFEKKQA